MHDSIQIDSTTTIHYWIYHPSCKRTIVMIHGFRGTHNGLEKLASNLPEYRIIIPDLPGFGATKRLGVPHTIENYAKIMHGFISKLNIKDATILGHSMGATILAEMLAHDPRVCSKAIMINPVCEPPTAGWGALKIAPGIAYHWLAGKILPEVIGNAILRNKFLFLVGSSTMTMTKDKELRKWIHWNHMTYMQQFSDRESLLEAYDSSSRTVVGDYTDTISSPLLMISGKRDTITSINAARRISKKMKDVTLVELDDVGHIVHYEKPSEAAQAIREFLRKSSLS